MLLFLKLTLAPSLVALAYLGGRRWGMAVSGWMAAFPIVAGPILFFFALEQGSAFAAQAAMRTLLGLLGFAAFCVCYAQLSRRWGVWPSLLAGWAVFLGVSLGLMQAQIPLPAAVVLVCAALFAARQSLPKPVSAGALRQWHPGLELGLRMVATAAMVLGLTGAAQLLGPNLSGLLTPFPVATSVLVGFAQVSGGWSAAAHLLSGSLLGMLSFACFCLVLHKTLPMVSLGAAFGLALAASFLMQALLLLVLRKKQSL